MHGTMTADALFNLQDVFEVDNYLFAYQAEVTDVRSDAERDKPFSSRLYNATEIIHLLQRIGVIDYKLLDEKSLQLSAVSRRMMIIARKPFHA